MQVGIFLWNSLNMWYLCGRAQGPADNLVIPVCSLLRNFLSEDPIKILHCMGIRSVSAAEPLLVCSLQPGTQPCLQTVLKTCCLRNDHLHL
jgi:hypothetical protein